MEFTKPCDKELFSKQDPTLISTTLDSCLLPFRTILSLRQTISKKGKNEFQVTSRTTQLLFLWILT
jgi:hypothetical protein